MRFIIFFCSFLGFCLVSPQIQSSKQANASIQDVGVIEPDGLVKLYYRDGNYIITRTCRKFAVLGTSPTEARASCGGRVINKAPIETFKRILRNIISQDNSLSLKPLTTEEREAFKAKKLNLGQFLELQRELDDINKFITEYGPESANLNRKHQIETLIRYHSINQVVLSKVNSEIEKIVNQIVDEVNLGVSHFSNNNDTLIHNILAQYDALKKFPCGLTGTVEERIRDCSYLEQSKDDGFVLVTIANNYEEIHKELSSGLLWNNRLPYPKEYHTEQCQEQMDGFEGLSSIKWRIPTFPEFNQAYKNGLSKIFVNAEQLFFWTSTWDVPDLYLVLDNGGIAVFWAKEVFVRCVGEYTNYKSESSSTQK